MPPSTRARRSGLLATVVLVAAALLPFGGKAAEPLRLTPIQLDTIVAGASSGGLDLRGDVVVSSGANRIGGIFGARSSSNLRSSSSSGAIAVWGYARGPGAEAYAQTDGAALGTSTSKQTIPLRGAIPGFAWAMSVTVVTGISITPPRVF